ncbi:MAG: helix-turn-helix domain-containing protein [Oscillospiraceae bacterium]|jgi:transcriptional regulator with XRE-family HTH domain|nr:helix-turn-helix domain-containing protein [Oscillospiraceae bacterium]
MNLYIAENIRRLRRERNITQEKLAECVGVTMQAVSKWERNEAYPDITLVLPLASYFGVSADELLGLDAAKNELRIQEYLAETERLSNHGLDMERYELLTRARGEFPNDHRVMAQYIKYCLFWDPHFPDKNCGGGTHYGELHRLCNRILDECTLDEPRYDALYFLALTYGEQGRLGDAKSVAARFPKYTASQVLEDVYGVDDPAGAQIAAGNTRDAVYALAMRIRNAALFSDLPPREKIRYLHKAIDLLGMIFEDGDYCFEFSVLSDLNVHIARFHAELGEFDAAATHVERGIAHAKSYDELPTITRHTSYLVRGAEMDMREVHSGFTGSFTEARLTALDGYFGGKPFGGTDAYRAIVERYTPFTG